MDQQAKAIDREVPDVDETVGANLKRFRQHRGMTLAALGDILGVTYQQVYKYETGENPISAAKLFAGAIVLQVPIEEFYAGLDGIGADLDPRELGLIQRTAGELAALPEPFRTTMIGIIQTMRRTVVDIAAAEAFRSL